MAKDMVVSDNEDKGQVFDLIDYQFALEVKKSHPRIIAVYTKLIPVLQQYAAYQCVFPVLEMVEESKLLAEMQLKFYNDIYKSKGLVKDDHKIKK